MSALTRRFFVGIDWGSETHHVCVVNSDAQIVEDRKVRQSADGLAEFLQWLSTLRRDSAASVVVAIEVPHGPVVEVLLEHGLEVSRSTRSSLTVSVTATFQPGQKMTAEMPSCSLIRYVRISIVFARWQSAILGSSVFVN